MDEEVVQQIVDEVFSSLEPIDTQGAALTEFLKAKGIATDEELAPFLKQAGNTSSVRWLAARVRIKSLISSAMKDVEKKAAEGEAAAGKSEDLSGGESSEVRPEQKGGTAGASEGVKKSGDGQAKKEAEPQNKSGARPDEDSKGDQAERPVPAAKKNEVIQPGEGVKEKVA